MFIASEAGLSWVVDLRGRAESLSSRSLNFLLQIQVKYVSKSKNEERRKCDCNGVEMKWSRNPEVGRIPVFYNHISLASLPSFVNIFFLLRFSSHFYMVHLFHFILIHIHMPILGVTHSSLSSHLCFSFYFLKNFNIGLLRFFSFRIFSFTVQGDVCHIIVACSPDCCSLLARFLYRFFINFSFAVLFKQQNEATNYKSMSYTRNLYCRLPPRDENFSSLKANHSSSGSSVAIYFYLLISFEAMKETKHHYR